MFIAQKHSAVILLGSLLLLVTLAFWPFRHGDEQALKTITFVSPLPVTPVVVTVPPIAPLTSSPITMTRSLTPTLPHDLLFVSETGLMRWRNGARRLETIVAYPAIAATDTQTIWRDMEYVISSDYQKVLVAYAAGPYGTPATHHLALYDPVAATVTALLTTTVDLDYLTMGDGNQWVAYLQRDVLRPPRPWWQTLFRRNACGCGEGPYLGTIYVIRLQPPYVSQKIAVCGRSPWGTGECEGIQRLLSDGDHVAWLDGAGFWRADLAARQRTLLAAPSWWKVWPWQSVVASGETGAQPQVIARIARYAENLYGFGLLNPTTWQVLLLPEWLPPTSDGELLYALDEQRFLWTTFNRYGAPQPPKVAVWQLQRQPPHPQFTKTEFHLPFPPAVYVIFARPLTSGNIGIALLPQATQATLSSGLYTLDLLTARLTHLNNLPTWHDGDTDSGYVLWSPDGLGVIYQQHIPQTPQSHVAYIPADGAPAVDLNVILGQQPEQISWLLDPSSLSK